jgi:hypothetical protein
MCDVMSCETVEKECHTFDMDLSLVKKNGDK